MTDLQNYPRLLAERATSAANDAERLAFTLLSQRGFEVFAEPSGSTVGFPDFGLRAHIGNHVIDLHVEFKADRLAQMGSMRDWVFDGEEFLSMNIDETKELLLAMMQNSPECVKNAKRMLKKFQRYCDPNITAISSSMLGSIKDQAKRRRKLERFAEQVDSYKLAYITDPDLGAAFISHYKRKFKTNKEATTSYLILMIGQEMWLIHQRGKKLDATTERMLFDMLGVDSLPKLVAPSAKLEVRIQPRILNYGTTNGVGRVDVLATYRLTNIQDGAKVDPHAVIMPSVAGEELPPEPKAKKKR